MKKFFSNLTQKQKLMVGIGAFPFICLITMGLMYLTMKPNGEASAGNDDAMATVAALTVTAEIQAMETKQAALIPTATNTPLPTIVPTATQDPSPTPDDRCASNRRIQTNNLVEGDELAIVVFQVSVREEPKINSKLVDYLSDDWPHRKTITVTGTPVCGSFMLGSDRQWTYFVPVHAEVVRDDGTLLAFDGWVAESDFTNFYVEPVR